MFPLLAMGLLGLSGSALGQQYFKDKREAALAEGISQQLGQAPQYPTDPSGMGPPTQGSGLLADPSDITRQLQFAQGLMKMPGGAEALQAFEPVLGRAIQNKQWTAQYEQQAHQWQAQEDRLTDQFQKQFGLQQAEARAMAAQRLQEQQNWQREFEQRLADAAERRRMEGERLGLERQRFALEKSRAERADRAEGALKIPQGYGMVNTATGPSLAPAPGTTDFAKAKSGEQAMVDAIGNVDALMDQYLGPQTIEAGGVPVRKGGVGAEWWGPDKASMVAKRGAIIAAVGAMRDAGVLQEGEYKRFEDMLPDVSSHTTSRKTFEAGYAEARRQFQQKLDSHRKANPWLVPPPPAGFK